MLALPATTDHGFKQGAVRPVVYAELVTKLLDNPQVYKTQWDAYTAQNATQVVAEQGTDDPPAGVQLAYPDPSRVEDGFVIAGSAKIKNAIIEPGLQLVIGVSAAPGDVPGVPFQTIRLSHGEQPTYAVSQIAVRLKRSATGSPFNIHLELYEFKTDDGTTVPPVVTPPSRPPLVLGVVVAGDLTSYQTVDTHRSATRSTSTLTTSMADEVFTFATPLILARARQYAVAIVIDPTSGASSYHRVEWEGYVGLGIAPTEKGGRLLRDAQTGAFRGFAPSDEGYELAIKVKVPTYVWDGTDTAYRERVLDLGADWQSRIAGDGYFDFSYRMPPGTKMRFRAWSSSDPAFGSDVTDLGATHSDTPASAGHDGAGHDGADTHVHDGTVILQANARRYVKIRVEPLGTDDPAKVTQSLLNTPTAHGVNVVFPERVYKFATDRVLDALDAITSVPSLSSKIDLKGYTAQAQTITPELADLAGHVTDPMVEVNFKNLPLEIRFGVIPPEGLTTKHQLAPYAFGKIQDYTFQSGTTSWITKPWTAELSLKVPQPNRRDLDAPLTPIDFSKGGGTHIIDALDSLLFNEALIPRRYKHEQSFADAKTYLANWITKRVINESTELRSLINQLLEVIGYFLVQDEDGKLKLIRYPRSGDAVATWGDAELIPGGKQDASFDESIVNLAMVFWGHPDPSGSAFAPGPKVGLDTTSIQEWAPGSQTHTADRLIKGYWLPGTNPTSPTGGLGGDVIGELIAKRALHASDGIIRTTRETNLSQYEVQVGDFVLLQTPIFLRKGMKGAMVSAQKFMVASKSVDVFGAKITWELVEARDANRPPTGTISVSPSSGIALFAVTVTYAFTDPDGDAVVKVEIDHDYDGVTFQADQTSTTASGTFAVSYGSGTAGRKTIRVRATDSRGGTAVRDVTVRAIVVPVAQIDLVTQQAPGQPMNVTLSGTGSTSQSSRVIQWTWYVTPTGAAEESLGTGPQITISMPYREATVRLVVTDEDGQTGQTTLLLAGNQLAPPDVTNFLIQQRGEELILSWDPNADQDLDGYELRGKHEPTGSLTATWTTADLLTPNGTDTLIKVTHVILPSPRPYGAWSFFVKAKDRSGNYSTNAISLLTTTIKPGNRFGLVDWNEKDDSTNWGDAAKAVDLIYESSTSTWYITSTGQLLGQLSATTLGALPAATLGSLGTLKPNGTYTCQSQDLGAIITGVRLSATPVVAYLGNPEQTNVIIECRIATTGAPDWGAWFPLALADVTCRYFQIRIRLQQFDGSSNVGLKDVLIVADLPQVTQSLNDLDVSGAGSGSTWTFPVAFQVTPRIGHSIQSITTVHFLEVVSKSKTAVTVKLRNNAGTDVGSGGTRLVDLIATGG